MRLRSFLALFTGALVLAFAVACSQSDAPPVGRWEGSYDAGDMIVMARLELARDGMVTISAPNAMTLENSSPEDRAAIRARLAADLATHWANVEPRKFDFDGKIFRKPGGIAPQMEWHKSSGDIVLILYPGTHPSVRVTLHRVKDFSDDPSVK
ncbi:MAG TPA: hypothetical protein VFI93_07380 [Rhizomicrobium sp.]|jgi:hypothetical protein|nr:hypothetical protein [Rhizomicrobium sp.]